MDNFGDDYPNSGHPKLDGPIDWPPALAALAIVVGLVALALWAAG